MERCRQLIVAAARVNLVKLVLDIPLNTQAKEERPNFQNSKECTKHTEEISEPQEKTMSRTFQG